MTYSMPKRLWAEFLGTFWLVFGGCGSAIFAATATTATGFPVGIGYVGVALAFGLTVVTGAYALGHLSGGHFNPAVTLGVWAARKIETAAVLPYIVTQIVGGAVAAGALFAIASGLDGFSATESGFASNGYGEFSPSGYSMMSAFLVETILTAVFLWVILGVTSKRAPQGFAPLAIGLTLTLIHLISIPITNTSVNPARSIAVALFAGGDHLSQVWLFIVAPILGAVIAGFSYKFLTGDDQEDIDDISEAASRFEA